MSINLNIKLNQLLCTICKCYLSCSPLQVLPNGGTICGQCASTQDTVSCRQFLLETILSKAAFPCINQKYGCEEQSLFDQTQEHEAKCRYRMSACPSLPEASCTWEGPLLHIPAHFMEAHVDFVVKNGEFKFEVEQNKEGILMVVAEDIPFVIRYEYSMQESNLYYDVMYFAHNAIEASYKLRLVNCVDEDFSITLKGGECVSNLGICNYKEWKILVLNNFLENLNQPKVILVRIDLKVTKPSDYNQIDVLKAVSGSKDVQNSTRSPDKHPQETVLNGNHPCSCKDCKASIKSHIHERMCPFRVYDCLNKDCGASFKLKEAKAHLESHNYRYFSKAFVYNMKFSPTSELKIFTIREKEVICIKCKVSNLSDGDAYVYNLSLEMSGSKWCKNRARIRVWHAHCEDKLCDFLILLHDVYIDEKTVLPCFKVGDAFKVRIQI